ncbi:MAG: Hpt domain-containing protein, partial [Gloeomargarita sp. DG_1_4_bins_134]
MTDLPQDEIMAYFRAEVPKLLAELETGLLRLHQHHSVPDYYRLLRAAHSLKGGAASVSMYSIQTLAQCLEDVFQTLLAHPDTDVHLIEDWLLQGFDCLRLPLSQWLKTGVCDPDFALSRAKVIYQQITDILGPVPDTMRSVTAADLEVDITQTIFENDIVPKITAIQTLLSQSEPNRLCGELRAEFDILMGLGEMLHLPALTRISQVVIQGLVQHPDQARVIGELAVRDLQSVLQVGQQGGEPSPALLAWAEPSPHWEDTPAAEAAETIVDDSFGGEIWTESADAINAAPPTDEAVKSADQLHDSLDDPCGDPFWEEVNDLTLPQLSPLGLPSLAETPNPVPPQEPGRELPDIAMAGSEEWGDFAWEQPEEMTPTSSAAGESTESLLSSERDSSRDLLWGEPAETSELEAAASFWEAINLEPNQESDSFWDEVDYATTRQPSELELHDASNFFREEVNSISDPASPPTELPNLSNSFWEEIGAVTPAASPPLREEIQSQSAASAWTGSPLPASMDINSEALEFFAQEAQDLLHELESGLLTLRQNHSIPQIHALMRAAHSIKGGAATVGLPVIQVIAHRLENALQALYQWPGELDIRLEEALLQAFDTLRQPLQSCLSGEHLDADTVLGRAEQAFLQLESILGTAEPVGGDAYVPSSQDLGVDMTATIFSGDIQQGLIRLQELLAQTSGDWLNEVTGQLEVFANLGELLNLSGWQAICQTGLTALTQHPEQASAIMPVLLRDLRQGYDRVMAGEREQGGVVSPELQAFLAEDATANLPPAPVGESPVPPSAVLTQDNISTLFDRLPPAADLATAAPAPPVTSAPAPAPSQPVARGASVRVEVSRLEQLNNLIGELVIQENGSFLYQQQLQKLVQTFGQRLNKFEALSRMLQDAADQLTLTANKVNRETQEFDPLQMDSYNQLYTWVQTVIEEMAQVGEVMRDMGLITQQAQENLRKKQQTLKQIRGDLLWIRMVPLNEVLQRFPRMIRDLCVQYDKQVEVRLIGANTLVDKMVLEKLSDPLVHLVRNAFDHGIESPQVRIKNGKKPEGTIEIQAYYRGNQTYITVRDDGQGINLERVRQKAIEKQIFTPEKAANASKSELLNCLFAPGFSTAVTVSDLSGRGVGLDVVRLQIQELKGTIHIHTEPGQGTAFTIRLPLTLTITKLLVFSLDRRLFALAVDSLAAIISANEENLITMQGRQLVRWQGRLVPLIPPSVLEYRYPVRWVTQEEAGLA